MAVEKEQVCKYCGEPIRWMADRNSLSGGDYWHVWPIEDHRGVAEGRRQQCADRFEYAEPA